MRQLGVLSSALEHIVPEQLFVNAQNPGEAVSAVKALTKANVAGQRVYTLTAANQAESLPHIHHDAGTMAEIRAALAAGLTVITHTDAVSVPGWSGAGYILLDPLTGDGAYKISGGANGGLLGIFLIILGLVLFSLVIYAAAVASLPSVAFGILTVTAETFFQILAVAIAVLGASDILVGIGMIAGIDTSVGNSFCQMGIILAFSVIVALIGLFPALLGLTVAVGFLLSIPQLPGIICGPVRLTSKKTRLR